MILAGGEVLSKKLCDLRGETLLKGAPGGRGRGPGSLYTGYEISASRIYAGICSYTHWWANVLQVPEKLAWLIQPLKEYERELEPLLPRISDRLHELINMNIHDGRGRVIPALAKVLLQAMGMVEARIRGAAVQRVETRNINLDANDWLGPHKRPRSLEEIEQQIADLRELSHEPKNSLRWAAYREKYGDE